MAKHLPELRRQIRPLLDLSVPRDALAAYYALYHDPARTQLFVEEGKSGRVEGFASVCQTGRDLFRLLVALRAPNGRTARALLAQALAPRRPYYLVTTLDLRQAVKDMMEVEQSGVNQIYELSLEKYSPAINVLVVPAEAPDGSRRFVIRSQGEVVAESGVNWRSPHFAEVYVWTTPQARGRGWGKAVANACVAWVVRSGTRPIYAVSEENERSIRLARSIGFVDTGAREFAIEGMMRGELSPSTTNS